MTKQDLNQSTDSVTTITESVKSEDSIEAKLSAMFNSPERIVEDVEKESKAKPEVLPTRRSKRKRTISGPSAEQIIEEINSKKPSKRSATKTFKKEEEIIVEQPSRRSATLNKSYTEYGDFDENVEVDIEGESDDFGDFSEDLTDFKPEKKKRISPKRKKAKTNNNVPKTSKKPTENRANPKSEYFMPGDLILSIGQGNYKNSQLYGIKNMETFEPKDVMMKICVAVKESFYHVSGKKFMTKLFDVGKESERLEKHELCFKYRESDERIQQYLNYHKERRNSLSTKHYDTFKAQLELLQSIEQLELPSSAEKERLQYLKGLIPVPKAEQEVIEEVTIKEDNEVDELIKEPIKKPKKKKEVHIKAKNVIDYFVKNKKMRKHLKDICEGNVESERHDIVRDKDCTFGFDSPISRLTNMCFLPNISDTDYELFESAKMILGESSAKFSSQAARDKYVKYVLMPEGIIFYLRNAKKMGAEEAHKHYLETKNTEIVKKVELFNNPDHHQQHIHPVTHDPNDEIPELE